MPKAKKKFWKHAQWGSYAIPVGVGQEPGADAVLDVVNQVMDNYFREGYEPVKVLAVGGPMQLVLEGSGALSAQRVLILWGMQDWLDEDLQRQRLRDLEDKE